MIAIISFIIFAGALATSTAAIAGMIVPQWQRIARLVAGHVEGNFAPLATLAIAERRIAVRRWSTQSTLAIRPLRAAA